MVYTHKHTHPKQIKKSIFFLLPSVKHVGWSLLLSLSLFEDKGLSYYPPRTFIDLFFPPIFTMCPYHPSGLYESDPESALLKLGIPPVLERVGTQIFLFLICLLLSVKSDLFRVLITTLFMVSKFSGLGTGTRLKSLAHQTEIHF